MFSQKLVFSQFRLKLGRSRGVRGEGADHTKTLSRTLIGFGLTKPKKVNFSTFDGKLEGSFLTKYLQFGFWISPKAKGFWLNGLRRKSILKDDPKNKIFSGILGYLQQSSFVDKMASCVMPFLWQTNRQQTKQTKHQETLHKTGPGIRFMGFW